MWPFSRKKNKTENLDNNEPKYLSDKQFNLLVELFHEGKWVEISSSKVFYEWCDCTNKFRKSSYGKMYEAGGVLLKASGVDIHVNGYKMKRLQPWGLWDRTLGIAENQKWDEEAKKSEEKASESFKSQEEMFNKLLGD